MIVLLATSWPASEGLKTNVPAPPVLAAKRSAAPMVKEEKATCPAPTAVVKAYNNAACRRKGYRSIFTESLVL